MPRSLSFSASLGYQSGWECSGSAFSGNCGLGIQKTAPLAQGRRQLCSIQSPDSSLLVRDDV